jgi:AAA family ATP:ADP antiporter
MASEADSGRGPSRTPLDHALRLFGDVRAGEGATVLLMSINVFVVLVAYYVIKTVREPLILTTGGAELKAYAAAFQALALMVAVPLYSHVANRVRARTLIYAVTLFFIACLELFFLAYRAEAPMLGFAFYVWVGIFNVAIIAQFWSFANDVYSVPAGERLFPLIAIGATVGAPVGAWLATKLFESGLAPASLMQVSAALLVLHLLLYRFILARPDGIPQEDDERTSVEASIAGGFVLVFRNRYLRFIAALVVLLNLVNTTGEYLLSTYATERADAALAVALDANPDLDSGAFMDRYFGVFYGDFFFWVNSLCVVVQAFFVSRIVKYLGLAGLLFAMPLVALGNYGWIAMGLGFAAFRGLKTVENATDYSIMNTAKAMLWLPTTHDEKFQAKQAVDTFFVRFGDVLAAILVYIGTQQLAFGEVEFARVNVALIVLWMIVSALVLRSYRRQTRPG